MKRIKAIGIFAFLSVFILGSCGQRRTEADFSDLREDKREVIIQIDEALAASDFSEFKRKSESALNDLSNHIDDYHDEMDRADRRINKQTRDAVISMKEKKAAIEYKLELVDNQDSWTDGRGTGTGAARTDRMGPADRTGPEHTGRIGADRSDRAGTDRTDRTGVTQPDRTAADRTDRTATDRTDRTATDRTDRTGAERAGDQGIFDRDQDAPAMSHGLVNEIRNDLQELKREIEQFIQENL